MNPIPHADACIDSSRLPTQSPACLGRRLGWGSVGLLFALMYWSASAGAETSAGAEFRVTQTTRIGGEGSWDYAEYDAARHRLFVARVGGTLVLDANTMKPVGTIPALAGTRVHGVAFAGEFGIGMTSDGNDQTSTVFDLTTLAPLRRVALGISPDTIIYDPASHQGIGFDGDDNMAVAFDPRTGSISARVKLPGSPEAPAVGREGPAVRQSLGHFGDCGHRYSYLGRRGSLAHRRRLRGSDSVGNRPSP